VIEERLIMNRIFAMALIIPSATPTPGTGTYALRKRIEDCSRRNSSLYEDFTQTTDDEVRKLLETLQAIHADEEDNRELTHA
jgi:hypothetical protein